MKECLFVGGYYDGRFLSVDIDMKYIELQKPIQVSYYYDELHNHDSIAFETISYKRVDLFCYGKEYHIYTSGAEFTIIDQLIDGYRN